jgi:endonuclease YncB( thermonuclease family)
MYQYSAVLLRVIDGDTMHFAVNLGCEITLRAKIRVLGINAPELSTTEGQSAKAWAQQWFTAHAPTGLVTLTTVKDHTEKYGRYLGTITAGDGAVFNDDILAAHMAIPYNP